MSTPESGYYGALPELRGEAYLLPRIEPTPGVQPFDSMGLFVVPGPKTGTASLMVTGRQGGDIYPLGAAYEPYEPLPTASDEPDNFAPTTSALTIRTLLKEQTQNQPPVQAASGPRVYTIPFRTKDGGPLRSAAHIPFKHLDGLFADDIRAYALDHSHQAAATEAERDMLVQAYAPPHGQPSGDEALGNLRRYERVSILVAAAGAGRLAIATVGHAGSLEYLLDKRGNEQVRLTEFQQLRVNNEAIHGTPPDGRPKRVAGLRSWRVRNRVHNIDL